MFRTELTIAPASRLFSRTARLLTLGSCFADSIGQRLTANKVATLANPFGTVFQPLAATKLLRAALGEEVDWQQHLVSARGRWQSYDLHGSIGADTPVELLQRTSELVYNTGTFLRSADAVLLTLGTAWVYRLRETGELVSNCHKMPADLFVKELLTPDEIINNLAETHAYLRRINPRLRVILTLSPVRHLKDTLPLNAVSKSVLRVACHILSELLPDVAYFPAYELLTDDLRDYRFYAADMLHPSPVAEEYIWEKFARTFFDADFGRFRKEWASIRQALAHRPLYEGAPEHRHFLEATRDKLQRLAQQHLNLEPELADVRQRLAALPEPVVPMVEPEPQDDGEERVDIGGEATAATLENMPAVLPARQTELPASIPLTPARQERQDRNKRHNQPGRNDRRDRQDRQDREQPAAMPTLAPTAEAPLPAAETQLNPLAVVPADAAAGAATNLVEEGIFKKKKRRSRGGAKRTARKHAAQLAAEAALATSVAGVPADLLPPVVSGGTAGGETPVEAAVAADASSELLPTEATPAADRTRKSSVITKSVPVKRGGRNRRQSQPEASPAVPANADGEVLPDSPGPVSTELAALPAGELPEAAATPAAIAEASEPEAAGKRKATIRPLFAVLPTPQAATPEPAEAPATESADSSLAEAEPEAAVTQVGEKARAPRRRPAKVPATAANALTEAATAAPAKKAPRRKAAATPPDTQPPAAPTPAKARQPKAPVAAETPPNDKPRKAPARKKKPSAPAAE